MPTIPSNPEVPRYLPEIPFPAYAYVPGRAVHPAAPDGHLQGRLEPEGAPLDDNGPSRDPAWLRGVDLFNHGYYWEAHEVWEGSWKACGKRGAIADFLKALIKLAACGVKVREGQPNGVQRHAAAAHRILSALMPQAGDAGEMLGLSLSELRVMCETAAQTPINRDDVDAQPRRVFPFVLRPR